MQKVMLKEREKESSVLNVRTTPLTPLEETALTKFKRHLPAHTFAGMMASVEAEQNENARVEKLTLMDKATHGALNPAKARQVALRVIGLK